MKVATRQFAPTLDLSTMDSIHVFSLEGIRDAEGKGGTFKVWDGTLSGGQSCSVFCTVAFPSDAKVGEYYAIWTGGSRASKRGRQYDLQIAKLTADEFRDFAKGATSEQALRVEFRKAIDARRGNGSTT